MCVSDKNTMKQMNLIIGTGWRLEDNSVTLVSDLMKKLCSHVSCISMFDDNSVTLASDFNEETLFTCFLHFNVW